MPEQRATGSGFAPNVPDWIALVLMIVGGAVRADLAGTLFPPNGHLGCGTGLRDSARQAACARAGRPALK